MLARVALVTAVLSGAAAAPAVAAPCDGWRLRTVAQGLGSLENLEPDGRGGLFLSATARGAVERLDRRGRTRTVTAGVPFPGGLRLRGRALFVNTGDAFAAGQQDLTTGTIERIDLRTGRRIRWTSGLTMPNGLVFTPGGDALVSRDVNGAQVTGITRVPAATRRPRFRWSALPDTNGLALAPDGRSVFAVETFGDQARLFRIPLRRPGAARVVARLGPGVFPDDLTIDAAGVLYVTGNVAGQVFRVDPRTGRTCIIARGLKNPSAIKHGLGRGAFGVGRLYVSGFDGTVRELSPPRGLRLRATRWHR